MDNPKIEYKLNALVQTSAVSELFRQARLDRPVTDPRRMAAMLANATHVLTAWDGGRLVGIARSLSDSGFACLLSDLAVDPEYAGQGIGKELVTRTKAAVGPRVTVYLLATPETEGFCREIGMESVGGYFQLARTE